MVKTIVDNDRRYTGNPVRKKEGKWKDREKEKNEGIFMTSSVMQWPVCVVSGRDDLYTSTQVKN